MTPAITCPPRRFLFVNYEYPPVGGGGGTCCRAFARALVRRGHEVEVVTARWGPLRREVRHGRFLLRRLPALRRRPGQSNPIEMMSYVAVAAPYLLLRGGPRPDIAVSFHTIPSGMAAFPLCALRGVPHIALFRGGDVPGWLPGELQLYHRLTLWLNRVIVYHADQAMANSNGLAALAQKSFPHKQIGVLCNGVDVDGFSPPQDNRAQRNGPVRLLFVGRITTQKGIDTLLSVLGSPALRDGNWHLDIAGDGPQLHEYQQQAARLGIAPKLTCHGWLDRPATARLYRHADLLVFPSRYEGMPNVVLEAMAAGLPVIGTNIAGTEQLLVDGKNGYMVAVDDEAALGARIKELIENPARREAMGEAGREEVANHWSWNARAAELETVAEEILQRRGLDRSP